MIVYGHRGAKGEAPENTLEGFVHAHRQGIRHFELDLVLSKDGIPVLVHDLTVDRTTTFKGRVSEYTLAELTNMDARRNVSSWPSAVGIPSLNQLLDQFDDLEHLQLEVKSDRSPRMNVLSNRLTEIIQARRLYDRVAITSSDIHFLKEIRRRDRNIRLGLVAERKFPRPMGIASRLDVEYLCINWKLISHELVEHAHRKGMHVSAWTVNRIFDMLGLENMGVDSIITDYPTSTFTYFDNRTRNQLALPDNSDATAAGKQRAIGTH